LADTSLLAYQKYDLHSLNASYHYQRGEYAEALAGYRAAIKVVENMMGGLYPDEIRFFFVIDKYQSYLRAVDCLLKMNRINQAFLSNLKAVAMLNYRGPIEARVAGEVPEELLATREKLRASLRKLACAPRPGQRLAAGGHSYPAVERRLLANERRIHALLYPESRPYRQSLLPGFEAGNLLEDSETVINFVVLGDTVGAFWADSSATGYVDLSIRAEELEVLVRKMHFVFERSVFDLRENELALEASDSYLREIHRSLVEPLLAHITGKKLIILADGLLGQIPFSALRADDGSRLKDRFNISLLVDPNDLADRPAASKPLRHCRHALFAVSSEMLPAIDLEVRRIESCFPKTRVFTHKKAVLKTLLEELRATDGFVHIAAHASRSSENPLFSKVMMADGPLFPFELFGIGIKAGLVTLSGCQTAAPGLYYGNSFSLAKAFHQAGARHVLGSLWPVSDKLTMIFMAEFYRSLSRGGDVGDAYREALDSARNQIDNPAFWGSFILLGI
jgi:CHAT domain-containing protein